MTLLPRTQIGFPHRLEDCTLAQLAFLALTGTYGQQQVATRLLEAMAEEPEVRGQKSEVRHAFPKGRWTV